MTYLLMCICIVPYFKGDVGGKSIYPMLLSHFKILLEITISISLTIINYSMTPITISKIHRVKYRNKIMGRFDTLL